MHRSKPTPGIRNGPVNRVKTSTTRKASLILSEEVEEEDMLVFYDEGVDMICDAWTDCQL